MPDPRSSFDHASLVAMSEGKLFSPDSPRFPSDAMMMVDRITHISEDGGEHSSGLVIGELDIHPDLWFFSCHFPNDPVMPGCLGLDALWQLSGFYLAWLGHTGRCRAIGVGNVRFLGQVLRSSRLVEYQVHVARVRRKPFPQVFADAYMSVDGRVVYRAKRLQVGVMDPALLGLDEEPAEEAVATTTELDGKA